MELDALKVLNVAGCELSADIQDIACSVRAIAAVDRARDLRTVGDVVEHALIIRIADVDGVLHRLSRAARVAAVDVLCRAACDVDGVLRRIRRIRCIADVAAVYLFKRSLARAQKVHGVLDCAACSPLRASTRDVLERLALGDSLERELVSFRRIPAVGNASVSLGIIVAVMISDVAVSEAVHVDKDGIRLARIRVRALDDLIVAAHGMILRCVVRELQLVRRRALHQRDRAERLVGREFRCVDRDLVPVRHLPVESVCERQHRAAALGEGVVDDPALRLVGGNMVGQMERIVLEVLRLLCRRILDHDIERIARHLGLVAAREHRIRKIRSRCKCCRRTVSDIHRITCGLAASRRKAAVDRTRDRAARKRDCVARDITAVRSLINIAAVDIRQRPCARPCNRDCILD